MEARRRAGADPQVGPGRGRVHPQAERRDFVRSRDRRGGACGMLFDCFPFSTISIYRTAPWGAVTGAGCSAIVGFLAGVVSAAFSRPADNQTILTSASS